MAGEHRYESLPPRTKKRSLRGYIVRTTQQPLVANYNQRGSHRQLATGEVVARPLKRGVRPVYVIENT